MTEQKQQSAIPFLTVKDAEKSLALYEKAFGAKKETLMRSPDGSRVMHCCFSIGNTKLFMSEECPEQNVFAPGPQGSSVSFYLNFDNADKMQQQALSAGMTEIMKPEDMFWGDRMGCVVDSNGYKWNIAQHKQTLTPEQIQKNAAEFFKKRSAA